MAAPEDDLGVPCQVVLACGDHLGHLGAACQEVACGHGFPVEVPSSCEGHLGEVHGDREDPEVHEAPVGGGQSWGLGLAEFWIVIQTGLMPVLLEM